MAKKVIIALFSVIVIAVAAIGVYRWYHPTPLSLLKQMVKKLDSVDSFKAEMDMDLSGTVSIGGMQADLGLGSDLDMETVISAGTSHQKGILKISGLGLSYDAPMESYQQSEGTKMTTYSSANGGKWVKSVVDSSQAEESAADSQNVDVDLDSKLIVGMIQKIVSGEIQTVLAEETETVCDKEAYRIDISVAGDLLEDLAKLIAQAMGEKVQIPNDLDLSSTKAVLVLHIYKDSKLPAALRIDCTELGNALLFNALKEQGIEGQADRFVFEIRVPEYNTIDSIEIPQEVISSAVDSEDTNILDTLIPGMW